MSILIKDMEMPSCCGGCGFSDWSNMHQTLSCSKHYFEPCFTDHSKEYMEKRADFCPLVEIPEPHGALIDRDALNIGEYEREDDDTGTLEISIGGLLDLYRKMKDAPTVIEAEGSEDDADN